MDFSKYNRKNKWFSRQECSGEDDFQYHKKLYIDESFYLDQLFWKDTFEELGISQDHPKAGILKNLAWELGHSAGYSEIFSYASDLADFLME
jgi:hypothetical protein